MAIYSAIKPESVWHGTVSYTGRSIVLAKNSTKNTTTENRNKLRRHVAIISERRDNSRISSKKP